MNRYDYVDRIACLHEDFDQILKGKHIVIRGQKKGQFFNLFRRHTQKKVVPASTAKIFLLNSLLEHQVDLTKRIEVLPSDISKGSGNNLVVGESYLVKDLLINLMTASSNTSAVVLARYLSEYIQRPYVEYINQKNESLGLTNTNLVNEHGLAHKFQYTTLDDLTHFLDKKIADQNFLNFMKTPQYEFSSSSGHQVTIENTYTELDANVHLGVKTGTLVPGVYNIIVFFKIKDVSFYIVDFYNESYEARNQDIAQAIYAIQNKMGWLI